ncbi:MAG: T9SS type A sorting domain-containing protein [Prevotellaceae bacterium]|jgi:hypothetical protein|nr:T9SS type A sorting domain-containing protein [Prevotellaceae bacterium]
MESLNLVKKTVILLGLPLALSFSSQAQRLPAFPGAEGFGKYTSGGRGGRVIYVTNLNDASSGSQYEGSLRQALSTSGNDPITIVFRCGGVIQLGSELECSRSNVTLAGQTALGDGICVAHYGIKFSGNNIIVRQMRFRVGDEVNQNNPALTFSNGRNAIFDHCSFSWSTEENVNITDVDSVTLQWCINSESLYNSVHTKGARAYAAQWGGQRATYHHNLLAHHNSRMPRQNGNTSHDYQLTWDYRNNVHYNWATNGAFYGGGIEQLNGYSHSNLVNNYYVPGPATTTNKNNQYFCAPSGGRPAVTGEGNEYHYGYGLWWLSGNVMKDNEAKTANNFSGLSGSQSHWATAEFAIPEEYAVTTTSAEDAYLQVLKNAGATSPKRDSIDIRIAHEVQTQTAAFGGSKGKNSGIIDSHKGTKPDAVRITSFNAWASYYVDVTPVAGSKTQFRRRQIIIYKGTSGASTREELINDFVHIASSVDTDLDGMPDEWEELNGLDKNNPDDRNSINPASGYTMLETYLNYTADKSTGIAKSSAKTQPHLRIYPNPASTHFTIETVLEPKQVEIYSMSGQKVASYPAEGARTFGVSVLPTGVYVVRVAFANGKAATQKLIKS